MMSRVFSVCVVVGALICCTSQQPKGSACADITGNYTVTVERLSGTCDPAADPKTTSVGITKADDGSYVIVLPGIEGGCPGTFEPATCKFTSVCELRDKTGNIIANSNISYTFTGNGFTGTSLGGLRPPAVSTPCEVTYSERGTKL